ncbi:MAG TPA: BON domain-containing protein [Phenylobacterium sp.]
MSGGYGRDGDRDRGGRDEARRDRWRGARGDRLADPWEARTFGPGDDGYGSAGGRYVGPYEHEDRRDYPDAGRAPGRPYAVAGGRPGRNYGGRDDRPDPGELAAGYGGSYGEGRGRYGRAGPDRWSESDRGAGTSVFSGHNERVERISDGEYDRGHFFGGGMNRPAGEHRGRGPKGYTRSDERIRDDLHDRLTYDSWLDATDIDVQVAQGEVTLSGTVASRDDRRRAEDLAETVAGVKHVQNNLRVGSLGGPTASGGPDRAPTAGH